MRSVKTSITEKQFDIIESKLIPLSDVSLEDARRVWMWYKNYRAGLIRHLDGYIAKKTFGSFLLGVFVTILIFMLNKII